MRTAVLTVSGDALLAANMCEGYSWIQRQLREQFAGSAVVYLNLANGSIGYLPPADLYDLDVYPVWQTPFARGGLERMIDEMTNAIEQVVN